MDDLNGKPSTLDELDRHLAAQRKGTGPSSQPTLSESSKSMDATPRAAATPAPTTLDQLDTVLKQGRSPKFNYQLEEPPVTRETGVKPTTSFEEQRERGVDSALYYSDKFLNDWMKKPAEWAKYSIDWYAESGHKKMDEAYFNAWKKQPHWVQERPWLAGYASLTMHAPIDAIRVPAKKAADLVMDPINLLLMYVGGPGAAEVRPMVAAAADSMFTAMMAKGVYDSVMNIGQKVKQGDYKGAAEELANVGVDAYFTAHSALGVRERLELARELKNYNDVAQQQFGKKWYELKPDQKATTVYKAIQTKTPFEAGSFIRNAEKLGMRGPSYKTIQRDRLWAQEQLERARRGSDVEALSVKVSNAELEEVRKRTEENAAKLREQGSGKPFTVQDRRGEEKTSDEPFVLNVPILDPQERAWRSQKMDESHAWETIKQERIQARQEFDAARGQLEGRLRQLRDQVQQFQGELDATLPKDRRRLENTEEYQAYLKAQQIVTMHSRMESQMQTVAERNMFSSPEEMLSHLRRRKERPMKGDPGQFTEDEKDVLRMDSERKALVEMADPNLFRPKRTEIPEAWKRQAAEQKDPTLVARRQLTEVIGKPDAFLRAREILKDYGDGDLEQFLTAANKKRLAKGEDIVVGEGKQADLAAAEFMRRQEEFWREMEGIDAEADLKDAATEFQNAAERAPTPEDADKLAALAEEARNRAEAIRTDLNNRQSARAAQTIEMQVFPESAPIPEVVVGRKTKVIVPDRTQFDAHYAIVKLKDLVTSHDPLSNYVKVQDYIWDEGMQKSPVQDRDYTNNKELKVGVELARHSYNPPEIFNTAADGTSGPPVVRRDGIVLGGNGRTMRTILAYKNGEITLEDGKTKVPTGIAIVDYLRAHAAEFGISSDAIPAVSEQPMLVRVLDEDITKREDLVHLGINLNRDMAMGKSEAESSVSLAEMFTPEFMDWVSGAFENLGDDASLADLMRERGKAIIDKMTTLGLIPANKLSEFRTPSGDMTETAQSLFKRAARGRVIRDPEVLAKAPEAIVKKVDRALAPLFQLVANGGEWDFTSYLTDALDWWRTVDSARDRLREIGKASDSMVEKYLHPENFGMGTGYMIERETPHPITEALMKLLEESGLGLKRAIQPYVNDSEGLQPMLGAIEPPRPYQSFNEHIGSKVGMKIAESDWGTLRERKVNKVQRVETPHPIEQSIEAAERAEGLVQAAGLEVVGVQKPADENGSASIIFQDPKQPGKTASAYVDKLTSVDEVRRVMDEQLRKLAAAPSVEEIKRRLGLSPTPDSGEGGQRVAKESPERGTSQSLGEITQQTIPPMNEATLREKLRQHPGFSPAQVETVMGLWRTFAEKMLGQKFDDWLAASFADVRVMGESAPASALDQASRSQFGEGMEPSQIDSWVKRQGKNIRFEPYGEQGSLFGGADQMYRLWNRDSKESLIVTESQFNRLKELNPNLGQDADQGKLFSSLSLDPTPDEGEGGGGNGMLFQEHQPTWFLKTDTILDGPKAMFAGTPEQWSAFLKNHGVKEEEMKWNGLDDFLAGKKKVTRDEVREHLRENAIQVTEVVLRDGDPLYRDPATGSAVLDDTGGFVKRHNAVRFNRPDLVLAGEKKNYSELLLTLPLSSEQELLKERRGYTPTPVPGEFRGGHFEESNVLAHVRFDERTDVDGRRVLLIEEVQSDWHQKGKKQGYQESPMSKADKEWLESKDAIVKDGGLRALGPDRDRYKKLEQHRHDLAVQGNTRVPDAPFKSNWHELAMKRMLRWAAEHGYDRLAWVTGEQTQERYDLSKKVDYIRWAKQDDGTFQVVATPIGGGTDLVGYDLSAEKLPEFIGKDIADKIIAAANADKWDGEFSGIELKIGGKWAENLYDKAIPNFLRSYGKKWGAKVGETEIYTTKIDEREKLGDKVHSIDITPEMKESVLQGQPLFQGEKTFKKGATEFMGDGRAVLHLFEGADVSTLLHEGAHVMRRWLPQADIDVLEDWLKVKDGAWDRKAEETFARAFERYWYDGLAPNEKLKLVFAKVKKWMVDIYKTLRGQPINVKIPDAVRAVFDKMVGAGPEPLEPVPLERPKPTPPPPVVAAKPEVAAKKLEPTPAEVVAAAPQLENATQELEPTPDAKQESAPVAEVPPNLAVSKPEATQQLESAPGQQIPAEEYELLDTMVRFIDSPEIRAAMLPVLRDKVGIENLTDESARWYMKLALEHYIDGEEQPFSEELLDKMLEKLPIDELARVQDARSNRIRESDEADLEPTPDKVEAPMEPGDNIYIPQLRPAGFATLPKGLKWSYVEAPASNPEIGQKLGIPVSRETHGVIRTERPLTPGEMEDFDLASKEVEPKDAPRGFLRLGDGTLVPSKPAEEIFPYPIRKQYAEQMTNGEVLAPEQAEERVNAWRAEAERIGREEDNSNKVVISLFDRTGVMSEPWEKAGYTVIRKDLELGDDLIEESPMATISKLRDEGKEVWGVIAQPPCTSYAISGAQWWADQHDKANVEMVEKKYGWRASKYFDTPSDYADTLVAVAEHWIEASNPKGFHAMENPIGRIAERTGLPEPLLVFDPHAYGDPYTKRTQIWGDFNPNLPTANVEPTKGSLIHKLSSGDPRRSETPPGFAYAFFMVNHAGVKPEGPFTQALESPRDFPKPSKSEEPAETANLFGESTDKQARPKEFKSPSPESMPPEVLAFLENGKDNLDADWPVSVHGKRGVIHGWKWGPGLEAYYVKFDGEKKDRTVKPLDVLPLAPPDDYIGHHKMTFAAHKFGPQFTMTDVNAKSVTYEDGLTGKTYTFDKWTRFEPELLERVEADREAAGVEYDARESREVKVHKKSDATPKESAPKKLSKKSKKALEPTPEGMKWPDGVPRLEVGARVRFGVESGKILERFESGGYLFSSDHGGAHLVAAKDVRTMTPEELSASDEFLAKQRIQDVAERIEVLNESVRQRERYIEELKASGKGGKKMAVSEETAMEAATRMLRAAKKELNDLERKQARPVDRITEKIELTPDEVEKAEPLFDDERPADWKKARQKVFADVDAMQSWALDNKEKIAAIKTFQMSDGRGLVQFVPVSEKTLFQEASQSREEVERKIAAVRARLSMRLLPANERVRMEALLQSLEKQRDQERILEPIPDATKNLGPTPETKKPGVKLWTPDGEILIGREEQGETRTDRKRKAANDPAALPGRGRLEPVPRRPERESRSGEDSTSGRGVRPGERGSGERSRGRSGEQPRGLTDVEPARVDAPKRDRGTPIYDADQWRTAAKRYRIPENTPAPTVKISPEMRRMLIFPGQMEVVELALTSLKQFDSAIIATATGSGKTYTGAATLREIMEGALGEKPKNVLVLTNSQNLVESWKDIALDFDVEIQKLPPGVSAPVEPGVYATTYATAIGRDGIQDFKWDVVIADEIGEARRWYASQRGAMMKDLANSAGKVLYMSATPFHTALELGHMEKLGLWNSEGFAKWGKQFGIFRDAEGNWAGGNAPRKLLKLREQLVERGQYIEIPRIMDGYHPTFVQVKRTPELATKMQDAVAAFDLAESWFRKKGKMSLVMAVRATKTTFLKNLLERERLPEAIALAKRLEKEGYKVIFFSENKKEVNAPYNFMTEADEALGGEISRLLPQLPDVTEMLLEAFPDQIANFSGAHSAAREGEKEDFLRNRKRHLYATYGAGGIGVSLHDTRGDRPRAAIYLGPPWSGVMLDQAIGRPWRYGTNSDVHSYFMVSDTKAEVDLVLTKVAPRLESLRALVSGIHMNDPLVNAMRQIEANRDGAAAFALGQQHDAGVSDFLKTTQAPIIEVGDVEIRPAEESKFKGMKFPGEDGDPLKSAVTKLYQSREEYEEPPSDLTTPEDHRAQLDNAEFARRFMDAGAAPGMEAPLDIPKPERAVLADAVSAVAGAAAARATDGAAPYVVRRQWEMAAREMDAAKNTLAESRLGKAVRIADLYWFTHGREVIREVTKRAGVPEIGQKIARMLPEYHVEMGNVAGPFVVRWMDLTKGLSHADIRNLMLAKEGYSPVMNERVQAALPGFIQLMNDARARLANEGVYVEIFDKGTGQKRKIPFSEIENDPKYVPHRFDLKEKFTLYKQPNGKWKFMGKEEAEDLARKLGVELESKKFSLNEIMEGKRLGQASWDSTLDAIAEATGKSRIQVEDWLAKRHRDVPLVGNVERAREVDLPFWRTDNNVILEYFDGVGEVIARKKILGQNREKLEPLILKIPDKTARDTVNEIMDSTLRRRAWQDETRAFVSLAADWAVMSKMTFSSLKVPFHMIHAALFTNTRSLLKAVLHGATDWKEVNRRSMMAGSVLEQYRAEMMREYGIRRKMTARFLDVNGFQGSYKMGRILVTEAARVWMDDHALSALVKNKKSAESVRRQLRDYLLLSDRQIDEAVQRKQWSEEDYRRAGKALSDRVMFTFDPSELAPGWRARSSEPIADHVLGVVRVTTLLRSFTFKTAAILKDRLWDEARRGNFKPWIPFLLLYPAAGEIVQDLTMLATLNKKKFDELMNLPKQGPMAILERYLEDYTHATGLSMLLMMFGKSSPLQTTVNLLENVVGTVYSDILKTIGFPIGLLKAKTDYSRHQAIKGYVTGMVPATKPVVTLGEHLAGYDQERERRKAIRETRKKQKRRHGSSQYQFEPTPLE